MRTEVRFLIAITLMMGVLVGTNYLFPPVVEEEIPGELEGVLGDSTTGEGVAGAPSGEGVRLPGQVTGDTSIPDVGVSSSTGEVAAAPPFSDVSVEGPLFRMALSSRGAVVTSVRLNGFESFAQEGDVELVPADVRGFLGSRMVVDADTLDLSELPFSVTPADGLRLSETGNAQTLSFRYEHPTSDFFVEVRYTFNPDDYLVGVETIFPEGINRAALLIDMGSGLAFNEVDQGTEQTMMAYSANSVQEGIRSKALGRVKEIEVVEGPLYWAATKSKFFVAALLTDPAEGNETFFGSFQAVPIPDADRAQMQVGMAVGNDGRVEYDAYLGPIERDRLTALGNELQEVNPYGWRFFRPIIRPFVGVILWILNYLHDTLNVGYGWVLVIFGVMLRILLWPLNQKAMRSQIKNMAVQPLMQEIQKKYKHDQERLQKEMLKLYKEHGFNPLGGCLPMLIPFPVLIALFFVFQNTIQLRGESFLWLPDLSAPDPLYALPILMAASMFLIQLISTRSMEQTNPQMKMMMYVMPVMFGFFFFKLASGLNLYYMTANVATLPQQWLIAKERKAARAKGPLKLTSDDESDGAEVQAKASVKEIDGGGGGLSRARRRRQNRNDKK